MTRLESLQAEIKMLSERKRDLERRVNIMMDENEQLQNTMENLRERTLVLEKQCHEKDLQGSRRSDEEALEDQVRKLSEELRAMKDLYESEQERTHNSQEETLQLHNQVALLSVEACSWREETERMRAMADMHEPNEQLQSAIRDRDEAIAKKKAVEMELAKCKIDIMSLNSQLLDAIQQKLNLSQQLEAWQFASSGLFTVWLLWFLI
ncbi:BICD family-like cargo adapter 1 [Alosa alosa]|nr:BICD family-like cargo adapter 1 [Alosa alosa]